MKIQKSLILLPFISLMFSCSGIYNPSGQSMSVVEAANEVSVAAKKYDSSITAESLLDSIQKLDSNINENRQCTYSQFFLLLKEAFSGESWPTKTGARALEGYENQDNPSYSSYDDGSAYTSAFRFISDAGLVDAGDFGARFDGNSVIYSDDAWTLLDRIHWYYGTSAADDFYSYANYDQRIANCEDEGKTASDLVYVSNLIPRSRIVEWSKEQLVNSSDTKAFYEVFTNAIEGGVGLTYLRDYLTPLLESENVVTLIESMINLHNTYGYAPFYRSLSWGLETIDGIRQFAPTSVVYTCDDTAEESAKGGEAYLTTIKNFAAMFSTIMGSENEGQKYVEYYADFKHLNVLSYEENSSLENEKTVLGNDRMLGDTGISLKKALADIGFGDNYYWLLESNRQAAAFYDLFTDENLNALKGYCIYESMRHYIPLLPDDEDFNTWILGTSIEGKRVDNATYFFQYILPYFANGLVNYYSATEEYGEDIAVVRNLFDELRSALVEKASNSSWLSSEGANKIKQKCDNMKYFFGNSSDKQDRNELLETSYSSLKDATLMDCISLYQKTAWEYQLARCSNPPTSDFYYQCLEYAPFTANAYYMPGRNGIMVTMGYLTANERPSLMSQEELLANYGWVVGHEIGHGFDTNGFKYDYAGNRNEEWMSESDRSALLNFSSKFQSYIDGYEALIGIQTTGRIVLNEALADNIGISLSLAVGKQNGFSAKGFFEEGAHAFGGYVSRAYFINRDIVDDEHPFGRCRVNKAFSCFDEFHEIFSTKEGDHMYVAKEERLVLY